MERRPICLGSPRVSIRRLAQTVAVLTITILGVPLIPPEPAHALTSETPCNETSAGVALTVSSPSDFVPGETVRIAGHLGQTHTAAGQGLPFQPIDIEIVPERTSPEAVMATQTASDGPEVSVDRDPGRFYKLTTDQNGDFNARPRLTQAVDYTLKVRYRPLLICNTVEIPVRTHTLTLVRSGTGVGKVASEPTGIDCGTSCIATFVAATTLNLTPTPEEGNTFSGWSAPCEEGKRVCKLQMNSDVTITATFRGGIYPNACVMLNGNEVTVKVIVNDPAAQTAQRDQVQAGVAAFVTFLDDAGKAIRTEEFCGFGRFRIPPGSSNLAVELYEGGSVIPSPNLGTACDASAPTQGTITLAFRFGKPDG